VIDLDEARIQHSRNLFLKLNFLEVKVTLWSNVHGLGIGKKVNVKGNGALGW